MTARILIVEDVAEVRRLVRLVTLHRYLVDEAADGEQALALARSRRPDLVVLDVKLSGAMDGLQLAAAIHRDPVLRHTRMVMVTGSGVEADAAPGIDAFFSKPFSPLKLADCIEGLLSQPRPAPLAGT